MSEPVRIVAQGDVDTLVDVRAATNATLLAATASWKRASSRNGKGMTSLIASFAAVTSSTFLPRTTSASAPTSGPSHRVPR